MALPLIFGPEAGGAAVTAEGTGEGAGVIKDVRDKKYSQFSIY